PSAPPPPPSGAPPPPPPSSVQGNQASSRAIWALVLGILAWVMCGIFTAIPAWIMGKKEINEIDAGRAPQAGKTMAQIGMWLGIISTILYILIGIAAFIYFVIIVAIIGSGN
ncbi:MAG: DUF4190 domain-containing protein, partial [Ignavibacteria bacterium]